MCALAIAIHWCHCMVCGYAPKIKTTVVAVIIMFSFVIDTPEDSYITDK